MTKILKQTINFEVDPETVYEALMDPKIVEQYTGQKAKIGQKVGDKFTAYGDYIEGINLELIKGKKIVQSWRASDWPKEHYSEVIFDLKKEGKGTKLIFTQNNIPKEQFKEIEKGWEDYYWEPMREMFAKNQ